MTATTRARNGGPPSRPLTGRPVPVMSMISPHDLTGWHGEPFLPGGTDPVLLAVDLDDLEDLTHRDVTRIVAATPAIRPVLLGVRSRPLPVDYMGPGRSLLEHLSLTLVPRDLVAAGRFPDGHVLATGLPTCVPVADPMASAARLVERVAAHPHAAMALDDLLRMTGRGSVSSDLIAEAQAYSLLITGQDYQTWSRRAATQPTPDPSRVVRVTRERDELIVALDWSGTFEGQRHGMDHEIRQALSQVLRDVPRGVNLIELRAAGAHFCPRCLPDDPPAADPPSAHLERLAVNLGLAALRVSDRLSVVVRGNCVGSGLELAAFARRLQAEPQTRFRLPQLSMGLIPGSGGTVSLTRRIGRWRTAYLALSGDWIDAETAWRWRLVDAVGTPR